MSRSREWPTTIDQITNDLLFNPHIQVDISPIARYEEVIPIPEWMEVTAYLIDRTDRSSSIQSCMCNNTPYDSRAGSKNIFIPRPLSAYFSIKEDGILITETGLINPENNEAKLHTYLNENINHQKRRAHGFTIISGHLATGVQINGIPGGSFALLDAIWDPNQMLPIQDLLVRTLIVRMNTLPLTGDGIPVLPMSNEARYL